MDRYASLCEVIEFVYMLVSLTKRLHLLFNSFHLQCLYES